jgi:hypothetical protein
MKRLFVLMAFVLLPVQAVAQSPSASAVLTEFDRMAELPLWPGFDPRRIPVAVYDGQQTWLVRHPAPPAGFVRKAETLAVFPGQYSEMRANTSTEIGGVRTATLLLDPQRQKQAVEWAAVLIHESFHVFQRDHHPAWQGNEAELFLYPVDDAELLARRRLETEGLRRALAAGADSPASACWSARALEQRRQRFARMPAGSVGYERGTELNEGLATFVEARALGLHQGPNLPADGYGADQIRAAAYGLGPALATLLERFDPSWKEKLEAGSTAPLDELLAVALPLPDTAGCTFTPQETAEARGRAAADTAGLVSGRKERRAAFFAHPGLRLVVDAGSQPLQPQGFDPLNLDNLGGGEVLHHRWVKLGNDRGTLEVLDRESLTTAAGNHPLFDGVRTLTLTGVAEPKIQRGSTVKIEAKGFSATFTGAIVVRSNGVIRVTWPSDQPPPAAGAAPPTAPTPHSSTD